MRKAISMLIMLMLLTTTLIILSPKTTEATEINWTEATSNADWSVRFCHTSVVFDNKIWVMGGNDGGQNFNDTWYSTDGANWTEATASANWPARWLHASVVFDGKMWVLGGYDGSYEGDGCPFFNDVWWSTDGISWTQATAHASWSERGSFSVVVHGGKMWLFGGYDKDDHIMSDVWWSTDGASWTKVLEDSPWSNRYSYGAVEYNSKMWIMGGIDENFSFVNDVWSSGDGLNWAQITPNANWSARYMPTAVVYNNKIFFMGGDNGGTGFADTWYSTDGKNWNQIDTAWDGRSEHTAVTFDNKIWIMGGTSGGYLRNDVWSLSDPAPVTKIWSWIENPSNPLYGGSGANKAYYPCVIYDANNFSGYGNNSRYKMWYYDGSHTYQVISSDGLSWSGKTQMQNVTEDNHGMVLYCEDGFGNGYHYRLDWINNAGVGGSVDVSTMKYAWSNDGISWEGATSITQSSDVSLKLCDDVSGYFWQTGGVARTYYNPTATNPGWGTIDDISDDGSPWDYAWVISYSPIRNQEHSALAYSANGTYFIRFGGTYPILIADGSGWDSDYSYQCNIQKIGDRWFGWYSGGTDSMYYEGIGLATSTDGMNWFKDGNNPVLHKTDGVSWRSTRTYTPWVIEIPTGNESIHYRMYFTGDNGATRNIGCADFYESPPSLPYNETIVNGTAYASVYHQYLNVTINSNNIDVLYCVNGTHVGTVLNVTNSASLYLTDTLTPGWLQHDTTYNWYVAVDDGLLTTTGPTWWFHTSKAWDCDENEVVNYLDLSIVASNYGASGYIPGEIPADIVENGAINYLDLSSLVSHYGESY